MSLLPYLAAPAVTGAVAVQSLTSGQTPVGQAIFHTTRPTDVTAGGQVYLPASGKKFVLLGYTLQVTGNATLAAAGIEQISMQDNQGGANVEQFYLYLPASVPTQPANFVVTNFYPANGYVSSVANNNLYIAVATALTAGKIIFTAYLGFDQ